MNTDCQADRAETGRALGHDLYLAPSAAFPDVVGIDRRVRTTTQALYTQLQVQPVARLKLTAGLRYDRLRFDTRLNPRDDTFAAATAAGSPTALAATATQVSPKLGAAFTLLDGPGGRVELYANVARGLKSPYAFADFYGNVGVAGASGVPDLSISSLRSAEVGVQGSAPDNAYRWRAAVWNTRQEREADRNPAGFLQSFRGTQRDGFDLEGSMQASRATRLFANFSHVRAVITESSAPGFDRIPNVPENIGTLGFDTSVVVAGAPLGLSFADNIVGPQPITADNSLRTRTYHRYSARAAYPLSAWRGAVVSIGLIGYSRTHEEPAFDFGGGVVGITPKPHLRTTLSLQVPL